ncbi:MAG: hypothetical protein JNJ74_04075, partial [Xanthomonadales bacterium]|nr:hypothetical protein [Xanthomonadales bacterium]
GIPEVVDESCAIMVEPRTIEPLAAAIASALDRAWDEQTLSRRYSRDWSEVATDTLKACAEAIADARPATT